MHFLHDVASTNEVPLDIKLRNGRPVRVFLDGITDLLISQHIDVLVVGDTVEFEYLHDVVAEAAPGHLLRALHEKYQIVVLDPLIELLIELLLVHRCFLGLGLEIAMALLSIIMIVVVVVASVESLLSHDH